MPPIDTGDTFLYTYLKISESALLKKGITDILFIAQEFMDTFLLLLYLHP